MVIMMFGETTCFTPVAAPNNCIVVNRMIYLLSRRGVLRPFRTDLVARKPQHFLRVGAFDF